MPAAVADKIGTFREATHDFEWAVEFLNNAAVKNRVYGLVELDVTKARKFIKEYKDKTGETLSFTGWVIKCIAQAVSEHRDVQGFKKGKNKIVVFDDVDVSITIERELGAERVPLGYVVRKANEKTFRQIHDEIRAAQKQEVHGGGVLGNEKLPKFVTIFLHLPSFARKIGWWKFRRDPFLKKQIMGTVGITAVGMFGDIGGWPIVMGFHSLEFAIGGISKKTRILEGSSDVGEYLSLTVMFDEEVTYGAPAARFVARLTELVQSGFGLE